MFWRIRILSYFLNENPGNHLKHQKDIDCFEVVVHDQMLIMREWVLENSLFSKYFENEIDNII